MKARISRKFFCLLLAVVMVCTIPITALAAEPSGSISGSINGAIINQNAVSVELKNVYFESSVQVQLYRDETLLTTATLNQGILNVGQNYPFVTCCIPTEGEDAAWSLTPWTPRDDVVPNKAVLFVDGNKKDEKPLELNADEWAALPGTAFPSSGSINGAVITQNAVSVELENVNFKSSVEVQLYRGETLLTTATLKTGVLTVGQNYPFVTCCIPTEGEDAAWSLTPWTPRDDVVPNKAVLFVDGNKKDEKPLELNADEWAALPGTAFPYSGSIERAAITHDNGILKNAVSVDLKNVNFESSVQVQLYSGETLLTTATLQGVTPGSYGFLTCCIATETADEYWALTPWTPKDNIVPNKAVLFVDGHEQDRKIFTLDADEWAALPGTAFPYSGSIGGGYTYYTIKKATPKLNTYDHFAYVQGYPDGTVKPAGNITRAETAAILFRLMDNSSRKTYLSTKSGFRDVTAGSWYNTYVATLNNAGVITDSANGYFRPNEAITRAELAAMLAAFTDTTRAANYFNDVTANYWAANAIAICAKLGWINGYPDGSFRPDRNVTRAELMAMINRATGRAPKSADAFLPGMKTWSDNTADKWYYLDVQEATNSHSYAVSPTELWTALTAAPDWSRYE